MSPTVGVLKLRIQEILKTWVKELYLQEVPLEDDHTLVYYGILNADITLGDKLLVASPCYGAGTYGNGIFT